MALQDYNKTQWEDAPGSETPINADNLNNIEGGISRATGAIQELERTGVSPQAISTAVNAYLDEHGIDISFATPEQYGAAGDGTTDDTAAVNACLAENKCVIFKNSYAIDTIANGSGDNKYGIEVPSNRTLLFSKGAKLICIPNDSSQYNALYIVGKENITIDGMELECDRSREVIVRILLYVSRVRGV